MSAARSSRQSPAKTAILKHQVESHHGGLQLVLPASVSEDVRCQFGRHCQELDEMLAVLKTSSERIALTEFMIAHLTAQVTFLKLARGGE